WRGARPGRWPSLSPPQRALRGRVCSTAFATLCALAIAADALRSRTWPGFAGTSCFTASATRRRWERSRSRSSSAPWRSRTTSRLMAILLYGAGLRLLECARLRVKDVDFATNQIIMRAGKGDRDRVTMLPAVVRTDLVRHVEMVRRQHEADLRHGAGWVELPWALARKYPNAGREWAWQWVFPATRIYVDRETGWRR